MVGLGNVSPFILLSQELYISCSVYGVGSFVEPYDPGCPTGILLRINLSVLLAIVIHEVFFLFVLHYKLSKERDKSIRSWCDVSLDRSFMVDPLSYFQPVLHEWCNKGRSILYPVCGMMHIKEPLLLIGKSSPCGSSGFPLSLSEWSFTICLTPYNCK